MKRKKRQVCCMLMTMCLMVTALTLENPKKIKADDTRKYLNEIQITATVQSTYGTDGMYDTTFYRQIMNPDTYNGSYNTEENALVIDNAQKLAAFAKAVNEGKDFSGKYVKLAKNISLNGTKPTAEKRSVAEGKYDLSISGDLSNVWVPIGNDTNKFKGSFDGNGKKITGMTVLNKTDSGSADAGFFGFVDIGGEIKNLGIEGGAVISSSASDSAYAGGLAGQNSGSIKNSYTSGDISSSASASYDSAFAGGLAGQNSGSIENSYASGDISSSSASFAYAGGLAGYRSTGSIENSYASGDISSSASYASAGGLVGSHAAGSGSIKNSYRNSQAVVTTQAGISGSIDEEGTPLTRMQMTGTGKGRADKTMTALNQNIWTFEKDSAVQSDGSGSYKSYYFPRLSVFSYTEEGKPKYRVNVVTDITATPSPGRYTSDLNVKLAVKTNHAVIHYTTDGTSPGKQSSRYTGPISLRGEAGQTKTWQIRAVAIKDGYLDSEPASFSYTITIPAKSKTPAAVTKPGIPKLKISVSYNSARLSWNKVKGAAGYQIYRAAKKNGSYKRVRTTTGRSWTNKKLTTGKTRYYKVRAYKKQSKKVIYGTFSKKVKALPRTKAPDFKLKAGNHTIKVTWNKVKGASGYQVYRKKRKNGKYNKLMDRRKTRSYVSHWLPGKRTYSYKMRTYRVVKGKKVYSAWSKVKTKKTK